MFVCGPQIGTARAYQTSSVRSGASNTSVHCRVFVIQCVSAIVYSSQVIAHCRNSITSDTTENWESFVLS